MSDTVRVESYADLAAEASLGDREIEAVAKALEACAGVDAEVFVLDEWIADEKDLKPVPGTHRVFVASVERETEKACLLAQETITSEVWVPKSCSTRYTSDEGTTIDTPQIGLNNFETGGNHIPAKEVADE